MQIDIKQRSEKIEQNINNIKLNLEDEMFQ